MENDKKYCKHCGELIDKDCIVCPKCGKQVESLQESEKNIIINNSSSSSASASASASISTPHFLVSSPKSKMVALLLCIFLGPIGIHRFYVGKVGSGILYFATGGLCGIGWIYDIIKIASGTFTDGRGLVISQ